MKKADFSPSGETYNNSSNHRMWIDGVERQIRFVRDVAWSRSAVYFHIDGGSYQGWYYFFDAEFNPYTTKYDFELIDVGQ